MPFDSYTSLLTTIDSWLGQRPELTQIYPDFVTLAESRLYRDLRATEMMQRRMALLNEAYEWLPDDFLQMDRVVVRPGSQGGSSIQAVRLSGYTPGQLTSRYGDMTAPLPEAYAVEGNQIHFAPAPTPQDLPEGIIDPSPYRNFEINYYGRFTPLSDVNPMNAVFNTYPEVYLYAALIEAEPYLANDPRVALWKAMLDDAIARINLMAENQSVSALVVGGGWEVG